MRKPRKLDSQVKNAHAPAKVFKLPLFEIDPRCFQVLSGFFHIPRVITTVFFQKFLQDVIKRHDDTITGTQFLKQQLRCKLRHSC